MTTEAAIELLEAWVSSGGLWCVVDISSEHAVVDLCACTGEPMDRLESNEPELIRYLRTAQPDVD